MTSVLNVEQLFQAVNDPFESVERSAVVVVCGQIVHIRPLSRRLVFFDIRQSAEQSNAFRLSCVLKAYDENGLSIEKLKSIRHELSLGAIATLRGWVERTDTSEILFHVLDLLEQIKWTSVTPFVPEPPIKLKSGPEGTKETLTVDNTSESARDSADGVCIGWLNTGRCPREGGCPYQHHVEGVSRGQYLREWVKTRAITRRERGQHSEDTQNPHEKSGAADSDKIFADWVVTVFGKPLLNTGTGVLDVAGGRGNVSFELLNTHHIPTLIIDPRFEKGRLTGKQKKWARQRRKETKRQGEDPSTFTIADCNGLAIEFSTELMCRSETSNLLENCSFLLGLHPDEATDAIVDCAIQLRKPFAVVPCCVFSHMFISRRLANGGSVSTCDDLIQYLMEKHPNIQRQFLPFVGKNQVVYCTGYD